MASPVVGTGYNFKVVLLGEGCVGKTSVALRYVEDKFNDKHITTLQVTLSPSLLRVIASRRCIGVFPVCFQRNRAATFARVMVPFLRSFF